MFNTTLIKSATVLMFIASVGLGVAELIKHIQAAEPARP